MNGILTVWVITWRTVWPVMLIALLLPVVVAIVRRPAQFPPAWALTAPVVATASTSGVLYDLGRYPGLIRGPRNGRRVTGELYALPDDSLRHRTGRHDT